MSATSFGRQGVERAIDIPNEAWCFRARHGSGSLKPASSPKPEPKARSPIKVRAGPNSEAPGADTPLSTPSLYAIGVADARGGHAGPEVMETYEAFGAHAGAAVGRRSWRREGCVACCRSRPESAEAGSTSHASVPNSGSKSPRSSRCRSNDGPSSIADVRRHPTKDETNTWRQACEKAGVHVS